MAITQVQAPQQKKPSALDKALGIGQIVAPMFGGLGMAIGGGIGLYNYLKPKKQEATMIPTSDALGRRMQSIEQNPIIQIEEAKSALDYLDLLPEQREKLEKPLNLALTQKGNV